MVRTKHLIRLLFLLILSFAACTKSGSSGSPGGAVSVGGNNSGGKPVDAEGSFGNKPTYYFHVNSSKEISIVQIQASQQSSLSLQNQVMLSGTTGLSLLPGNGVATLLTWTDDGTATGNLQTVQKDITDFTLNDNGSVTLPEVPKLVLQMQNIDPAQLTPSNKTNVQSSTLDFLCSASPFTEGSSLDAVPEAQGLNIVASAVGEQFFGLEGQNAVLLSDTYAQKTVSPTQIQYSNSQFADILIDLTQPSPINSVFFKATVTAHAPEAARWANVNNLYCHSNVLTPLFSQTLFLTQYGTLGNMGGLAGADQFCTSQAAGGSKTKGLLGKWKALLSSSNGNAKDRPVYVTGGKIFNTNGDIVANDNSALWTNNGANHLHAAEYDQTGAAIYNATAWTGSNTDGTNQGESCNDWNGGYNVYGWIGQSTYSTSGTDTNWFSASNDDTCNEGGYYSLYCINSNE